MTSNRLPLVTLSIVALTVGTLVGCSQPPSANPTSKPPKTTEITPKGLNDTGATTFIADIKAKPTGTRPLSSYPGQDALFGKDKNLPGSVLTATLPLYGTKSFQFVALDATTGAELVSDNDSRLDPIFRNSQGTAVTPGCVKDRVTGLIWEYKNNIEMSPHYADHIFTWYNPDNTTNGGNAGQRNTESQCTGISSGSHKGIAGDTDTFVKENNAAKLCGFKDWRLPLVQELVSIYDYGATEQHETTDRRYFGNLHGHAYHRWAAESLGTNPENAWAFHFHNGQPESHSKGCEVFGPQKLQPGFFNGVMLVRSDQ